ncbi:hypothetical protein PHISCL_03659 [Aspergillus sclerotialis]|uniref:Altered inheritance of mitochondria protein 9, mitochondrial n=1 Tax=Aspergillus sclerotialis TaxID=2070753 RepID=A0A3A2ZXG2_9EURO|nr:hypothetical protein PHISCL_03659 [Aspergillus sclerotialis]
MTSDSKLAVMREVVSLEAKLSSLSFSHYGSIYFASDSVEGAVPAQIIGDVSPELKEKIARTFTIGPSVDRSFWNKERSTMNISRGPCSSPEGYAISICHREIAWIRQFAVPKAPDDPLCIPTAQNSPQEHVLLLEKYLKVVPRLFNIDRKFTRSVIWHSDLHSSNIFVDARPSRLVDYQGDILLKRPDNFDDLDDKRKTEIKQQIFKSILFQLYLIETGERNPILAETFNLDHGKARRLLVEYAGDTCDDDIVSFRETLINIERYWKELEVEGDCPIHFTEEDLRKHSQDAERWNEVQDFFNHIEGVVKRDGWKSSETYEAALQFFVDLRKVGLRNMKWKEREDFERQTRWAEK